MKRLMFALAAAAGVALGAYAEVAELIPTQNKDYEPAPVSFEAAEYGVPAELPGVYDLDFAEYGDPTESQVKVWYTAAEENPTEVRAYEGATKPADAGDNFLHVETDAKPLFRTFANALGIGKELGAQYVALDKVAVDTWVKFTAWDSEPAFAADDDAGATKFALWLQTSEDETQTNLFVKCGSIDQSWDTTPITVALDVSDIDVTAWHHVVVKTILDKTMGYYGLGCFTIKIDGAEVAAVSADYDKVFPDGYDEFLNAENKKLADAYKLFPSMVAYNEPAAETLFGVGFQGTGDIDLLSIANYEDPEVEVSLTFKDVTGLKVVKVEKKDGDEVQGPPYMVAPGTTVKVTYAADGNYILSKDTVEYTIEAETVIDPAKDVEVKAATAKIGTALYLTLNEAYVDAADGATITLLANCAGNGITIKKNLTIDFGGFTYTVDADPLAGSAGTQSQAFQLMDDYSVTFKNGTIASTKAKMLIQNYADLTLDGMTLDGTGLLEAHSAKTGDVVPNYTLSCSSGAIELKGGTVVKARSAEHFAMDTYQSAKHEKPTVTVNGATFNGNVELTGGNLVLNTGSFEEGFGLVAGTGIEQGTVTKADGFEADAPAGYKWDAEGKLVKIEYATLTIEQVANCTIVVSNDTEEVVTGAKFDKDVKVELTVYRTPAEGYELDDCDPVEKITMSEDVTVTAAVKETQEEAVKPGEPVGLGNPGSMTREEAEAAAAKLPIVIEQEDLDAGLTKDAVTVKVELNDGAYQAVLEPKTAPIVDDSVALEVTTENFGATVKNPVPGVYYGFVATDTLGTAFEAVGEYVRATSSDTTLKLTAPKGEGNACFYKLNAALRDPTK